jgi:transposase
MSEITRVGVDLAKQVIQVHAVDACAQPVIRRQLARRSFLDWCVKLPPGCLVVMEACTGAHHWARQLQKLGLQVRLIAPHLVIPYRKQGKSGRTTPTMPPPCARPPGGRRCTSCRSRRCSSRPC